MMLKEEKALRAWLRDEFLMMPGGHTSRLITALIRAVREDCAKVAEGPELNWKGDEIATAIRAKK